MSRFTGPAVLDSLQKYPVSVLCAPPTLYRSMVQEDLKKWTFNNLRHCVSAGEPLNEEVIYNWEEGTHLVIKEGYGQTETTLLIGTFKKMSKWVKPGSMGKVAPGYDVRIVNNMGNEVPRGKQGNIGVKVKPDMPPGLFKVNFNHHISQRKIKIFSNIQFPSELSNILNLSIYERDELRTDTTVSSCFSAETRVEINIDIRLRMSYEPPRTNYSRRHE